jgi:hypothetical protein
MKFYTIMIQTRGSHQVIVTGKHYRLRVECSLFCNLQSQARTRAILVIGLYELLGNPTTQLIEHGPCHLVLTYQLFLTNHQPVEKQTW